MSLPSTEKNYFHVIFKIMTQLRLQLDLKLKVELVEANLRKYFSYWLEMASSILM